MFEKKSDPWMLSTLLLAGIFVGIVLTKGYDLLGGKLQGDTPVNTQNTQTAQNNEQAQVPLDPDTLRFKVSVDDDPVLGDPDAEVTIVEFSDFQCPYCEKFFNGAYPELKAKYIDTGKVKIVFRDYPLSFHAQAMKAAMAAECANEQDEDKFWQMHDMLFQNQSKWSNNQDAVNIFKGYASDLGLNTSEFTSCIDSDKYANEISNDIADFKAYIAPYPKLKVGTPLFFINDKILVGALPFTAFEKKIEEELAK